MCLLERALEKMGMPVYLDKAEYSRGGKPSISVRRSLSHFDDSYSTRSKVGNVKWLKQMHDFTERNEKKKYIMKY